MRRPQFSDLYRTVIVLAAAAACWATDKGASASESALAKGDYSEARLIGGNVRDDDILAGVEIRLDAGWKTYWRNPGDSGVPPSFDWSGSTNVKNAQVLYPAPHRFSDAGGTAVGYSGDVIFPVKVTPERPGEPVQLKLAMDYGVCKTLCVPNHASLALKLPADAESADTEIIDAALALVPRPAEPGTLPALKNVTARLDGEHPELLLDAAFPAFAKGQDIFIDGGEAFVPVPEPVGEPENGIQRYKVGFVNKAEAERIKGKPLSVTLVTDNGSRETSITVQ